MKTTIERVKTNIISDFKKQKNIEILELNFIANQYNYLLFEIIVKYYGEIEKGTVSVYKDGRRIYNYV